MWYRNSIWCPLMSGISMVPCVELSHGCYLEFITWMHQSWQSVVSANHQDELMPHPPHPESAAFLRFWPWLMVQGQLLLDHMVQYGPGPLIIWKNILSQLCSRIIFEMHTASGACSKYVPGAVWIQMMLLDHIWLRIFFQIINDPGPLWSWTISQGQNLKRANQLLIIYSQSGAAPG